MFALRWYQREAVNAVWEFLRKGDRNPCVEIPTGGGKSAVIATLGHEAVTQWGGRVIVLAHVKELLEQNAAALLRICPDLDVGIYSAGLGLRNTRNAVIVGGIQSVFDKADQIGRRDLIIIDEAHLIRPDGEGRYSTFIEAVRERHPHVRVIGLTATPYRMGSGLICGPDNLLHEICYSVGVKTLIAQGYLCKLISKRGLNLDFSGLHIQAGEFVSAEAEKLMGSVVNEAVGEILRLSTGRKSTLIFCQGRDHARAVQQRLIQQGATCGYVDGDSLDRDETLRDFKNGTLPYLVNINVLSVGFDHPGIDCVVLLRPTASPGLYYQCVGRAFRIAPEKRDALVLDFGGNVARHGPIDAIEVRKSHKTGEGKPLVKECMNCGSLIALGYSSCPDCGFVFPAKEERTHETKVGSENIVSEPEEFAVRYVSYQVWNKKDDPEATPTMRVDYQVGASQSIAEWVCIGHTGYARKKAEAWWKLRSDEPCPDTASEAVTMARGGLVAETTRIVAEQQGKWWRVLEVEVGAMPETRESLLAVGDDDFGFGSSTQPNFIHPTPWVPRPESQCDCGCGEAVIQTKGGQHTVRCTGCKKGLYNEPVAEVLRKQQRPTTTNFNAVFDYSSVADEDDDVPF